MSDKSPYDYSFGHCNFCTLELLKSKLAEREKAKSMVDRHREHLLLRPENDWINVYLVTTDIYGKTLSEKWKASFMALTTGCAC